MKNFSNIQNDIQKAIKQNKKYEKSKGLFCISCPHEKKEEKDEIEQEENKYYFYIDKDGKIRCIEEDITEEQREKSKIPVYGIQEYANKDDLLNMFNNNIKNEKDYYIYSSHNYFLNDEKTSAFQKILNNDTEKQEMKTAIQQFENNFLLPNIGLCERVQENNYSYTFKIKEDIIDYLQIKLTFDKTGKITDSKVEYTDDYKDMLKFYGEEDKKFNDKIKERTSNILKNNTITNISQIEQIKSSLNQQIKNIPELKDQVIKEQLTEDFEKFQDKLKPFYLSYIGKDCYFSFGEMINEYPIKNCIPDWRIEYNRCKEAFQNFVEQEKEKYQKDIKEEHISYLKDMFDNSIKKNGAFKVSYGSKARYDVENNCIVIPQDGYQKPHILQFDDKFNIKYLEVYNEKGECIGKIYPDMEFNVCDNNLKKKCSGELKDIIIFDNNGFILPPHSNNTIQGNFAKFEVKHELTSNPETLTEIIEQQKKKHTKHVRIDSYQQNKRLEQTRQQRCDRIKYVRELYLQKQRSFINKRPNNIAKVKQKNDNLVIK